MCQSGCNGCDDCGGLECGVGPAGIDGLNSFTLTTATFVMPNVLSDVTINVSAISQMSPQFAGVGQPIWIETAGAFLVVSRTSSTMTVTNSGGANNAAPAVTIAMGVRVSPSGLAGAGTNGLDGTAGIVIVQSDYNIGAAVTSSSYTTVATIPIDGTALDFGDVGDVIEFNFTVIGGYVQREPGAGTPMAVGEFNIKIEFGTIAVLDASLPINFLDYVYFALLVDFPSRIYAGRYRIILSVSAANTLILSGETVKGTGGVNVVTGESFVTPSNTSSGNFSNAYNRKKSPVSGFANPLSGTNNLVLSLASSNEETPVYLSEYEVRRILKV
jgi:hypothetical protein